MCTNYMVIIAAAFASFFLEMSVDLHRFVLWLDPWLDFVREWARYYG